MSEVADNLVVGMEYVLKLSDGEVLDQSQPGQPLFFLQGHGNIIPGLEKELSGMKVGDAKEVTVQPAEGYGEFHPENIQEFPKSMFPEGAPLIEGMPLQLSNEENGQIVQAKIAEIKDESVVIDMNHPLAGETLFFSVTIAQIREATADELAHGHVHSSDMPAH